MKRESEKLKQGILLVMEEDAETCASMPLHFPTPTINGNYNRKGASKTSGNGLATVIGGMMNPDWTEWLMGWPIKWTDLKPLEMGRFQQWLQLHGKSSVEIATVETNLTR